MKYFLLIAGSSYYPDFDDRDWVGTFETREEAESYLTRSRYSKYDWHYIVDLREWMTKEVPPIEDKK